MAHKPQPRWQPISAVSLIAQAVDGMLEAAEEQRQNLQQTKERPYILDNALVQRILRVYGEQIEYVGLYEEQFRRWQQTSLTEPQLREVELLSTQVTRLRGVVQDILQLAKDCQSQTIEKVIAKSDSEVALDVLTGKLKP